MAASEASSDSRQQAVRKVSTIPTAAPTIVSTESHLELSAEAQRLIESRAFEDWSAEKILTWGISNFHPRLALSASFGAAEGMALLDMMHEIEPSSRVFVLDTGICYGRRLRESFRRRATRTAVTPPRQ